MEFYVGQKVRHKNYRDCIMEIVGMNADGDPKRKTVKYIKSAEFCPYKEGAYTWHYDEFIDPIEDPKPEYKIGDRFLLREGDTPFSENEEVEIVGFSLRQDRLIFGRNKDNTVGAVFKDNLKPLLQPLKEGQEVWVRTIFKGREEGDLILKYTDYNGAIETAILSQQTIVYIKNAEGQIVPYEDA